MKQAKFPAHELVRRDDDKWKTDTDTSTIVKVTQSQQPDAGSTAGQEEPHEITSYNCIFECLDEYFV